MATRKGSHERACRVKHDCLTFNNVLFCFREGSEVVVVVGGAWREERKKAQREDSLVFCFFFLQSK